MKKYIKLIAILITATIALQGFQCASREMTTAKVAIKSGDIPKAVENLQKEIEKNPKNGEAYILMAELRAASGDIPGAIALMDKAAPLVEKDPKLKDKPNQFKFEIFKTLLQQGDEAFTKYNQTKDKKNLIAASQIYSAITTIRPGYYEAYRLSGIANELSDKPDEAIKAYEAYIKALQPTIDIASEKNIYVGADKNSLSKLGASKFIRGNKLSNGDSTILEHFTVHNNDLYVMFIHKAGKTTVASWSYDPPKNVLQAEREIVPDNISLPIVSLATVYYNAKKDKENSLKYFKLAAELNPFDDDANSAIVILYQELGKPEEAITAINSNVKKNPNNPLFIAQLADIYMTNKQFDNAIEQYEKALSLDPNFAGVLRNVAACYGNKAAIIQAEQNEQMNAGKIKTPDTTKYYPLLRKSADYFERALKTDAFAKDPDAIGDLCGIYMVLGKNAQSQFDATLKRLENLESVLPEEKKETYYLKLLKIYGQTNNPKYSEIEKKLK